VSLLPNADSARLLVTLLWPGGSTRRLAKALRQAGTWRTADRGYCLK